MISKACEKYREKQEKHTHHSNPAPLPKEEENYTTIHRLIIETHLKRNKFIIICS
jgi:ribosomal protein S10